MSLSSLQTHLFLYAASVQQCLYLVLLFGWRFKNIAKWESALYKCYIIIIVIIISIVVVNTSAVVGKREKGH